MCGKGEEGVKHTLNPWRHLADKQNSMLKKEAYFVQKVLPGLCLRHSTERTYSFPTIGSGQWQELEVLRWQQNKLDLKKNKYDLQNYYFKICVCHNLVNWTSTHCVRDCYILTLACCAGFGLEPIFCKRPRGPQKCSLLQKWSKLTSKSYLVTIFGRHSI